LTRRRTNQNAGLMRVVQSRVMVRTGKGEVRTKCRVASTCQDQGLFLKNGIHTGMMDVVNGELGGARMACGL
jgi:hypothetical protein